VFQLKKFSGFTTYSEKIGGSGVLFFIELFFVNWV
ncbi:uncharacterized protein METZ01_LOCUS197868, partial [marine metagenome]